MGGESGFLFHENVGFSLTRQVGIPRALFHAVPASHVSAILSEKGLHTPPPKAWRLRLLETQHPLNAELVREHAESAKELIGKRHGYLTTNT